MSSLDSRRGKRTAQALEAIQRYIMVLSISSEDTLFVGFDKVDFDYVQPNAVHCHSSCLSQLCHPSREGTGRTIHFYLNRKSNLNFLLCVSS